jgi:hypothetical protein
MLLQAFKLVDSLFAFHAESKSLWKVVLQRINEKGDKWINEKGDKWITKVITLVV